MIKYDVIIIGAGAAGLMAMKELTRAGRKVCLLEAQEKAGGRCATVLQDGFEGPVETGAEFVHRKARLTRELLEEAGIQYKELEGKFVSVDKGKWSNGRHRDKQSKKFFSKVGKEEKDCSVRDVLDKYFADDAELQENITEFTEGFALADTAKVSAMAMKTDWETQEEEMFRMEGGYTTLINWMLGECQGNGAEIHFSSPVYKAEQTGAGVIVYASHGVQYEASVLLVTVSAGVLQAGVIEFVPALTEKEQAIRQIGFGAVIKILIRFKEDFWFKREKDLGFILSDEPIPVWWTQLPVRDHLLTGWLGGPAAVKATALPGDQLYEMAITSLSAIFQLDKEFIRGRILRHKIVCWESNPFVKGGYSFHVVGHEALEEIMTAPVNNKIYFAGEAVYSGDQQGTVEAALVSGKKAAQQILKS